MEWLLVLGVLFLLGVVVLALQRRQPPATMSSYKVEETLFSEAERSFLGVLDVAIGDDYRVFGKVRVADVVSVIDSGNRKEWQRAFNKISAKHFDFLVCSRNDLKVVAAVELDDRSHRRRSRKVRDDFLVELCGQISLPLLRFPAQRAYSVAEIREQLIELAAPGTAPRVVVEPDAGETAGVSNAEFPVDEPIGKESEVEDEPPLCPKCSTQMVRRRSRSGANTGQEFWGCAAFPKCRAILPLRG